MAKTVLDVGLPVESFIRATLFKHFCGGETIEQCQKTIFKLSDFNIGTILDYSVEGSQTEREFDKTAREIIRTIHLAKQNKAIPFCVFKMTGVARFELLEKVNAKVPLSAEETKQWERARHRLHAICLNAAQNQVRLFIDAEESWIQTAIDDFALEMMREFNRERAILFHTVQMYRTDRMDYLKTLLQISRTEGFFVGLKIVRGAYMEKERARAESQQRTSPIHTTKEATDRTYDEALQFCFANLDRVSLCAGTHNEKSTYQMVKLIETNGLTRNDDRLYFSQLLGMSDNLSYNLAAAGFNVAKYVPYGPVKVLVPYLTRRAQENTSIAGQTGRELTLIEKELKRRRSHSLRR